MKSSVQINKLYIPLFRQRLYTCEHSSVTCAMTSFCMATAPCAYIDGETGFKFCTDFWVFSCPYAILSAGPVFIIDLRAVCWGYIVCGNEFFKSFSTNSCTDSATGLLVVIETAPTRRMAITENIFGLMAQLKWLWFLVCTLQAKAWILRPGSQGLSKTICQEIITQLLGNQVKHWSMTHTAVWWPSLFAHVWRE